MTALALTAERSRRWLYTRLAAAFTARAAGADARTANRELSTLRSAAGWWLRQGWIHADPTAGLRPQQPAPATVPLRAAQVGELLALHRVRAGADAGSRGGIEWQETTSQVLRWLLAGRTWGPLFVTDRKAPAATAKANVCPLTGQARMSYRRAAEIFATLTRPLAPAGRSWTLHQLRAAERPRLRRQVR